MSGVALFAALVTDEERRQLDEAATQVGAAPEAVACGWGRPGANFPPLRCARPAAAGLPGRASRGRGGLSRVIDGFIMMRLQ